MQKFILTALLAASSLVATAQLQPLTLEDAITKRGTVFAPEKLAQLAWIPGTEEYAFIRRNKQTHYLCTQSVSDTATKTVLSLDELNSMIPDGDALRSFPKMEWTDRQSFIARKGNTYYEVFYKDRVAKPRFRAPEQADFLTLNPQHTACAYVFEDNLYVKREDGMEIKITSDGGNGIVYGQTVHREEFGIDRGIFWSPDGRKVAFYRMDEQMVEDYPLVDISTTPASLKAIKYPMAGRQSHHVRLGVYDLGGNPIVYMNTEGPADQYLCSIGWAPDSRKLLIGVLNRDQNNFRLDMYDMASGQMIQHLLTEKHEKYVEPEHPAWFVPGTEDRFIWMSEQDGYQHLYLYDLKGNMIRKLTNGMWEAQTILGLDKTRNYLFVEGTGETRVMGRKMDETFNATQRFVYAVDYEMGGHRMISEQPGVHHAILNNEGTHLLTEFSSIDVPLKTSLYATTGELLRDILVSEDPTAGYAIPKPELITLTGANGETLYGRLIKPSNFDPAKKYPVLVYIYGGPHAQMVYNTYLAAAPLWMYYMAEQGYIIATVDTRGSANRGLAFEQATFRNLGHNEMADIKQFADYLKDQKFVDGDRMALHGWSFGGFLTINTLLTYPGLFQVGVAGGPVCDWSLYEVMYTERYMDTPTANPEGFSASNLVDRAGALKDELLIIHGTMDNVVVWQHSQRFIKACVDEGVQVDYFIYPDHEHNVLGTDRVHLMQKVLTYIDEQLERLSE